MIKTTWEHVETEIRATNAKNVRVVSTTYYRRALLGNDGTILSTNADIALGYVDGDYDAINCCDTRRPAKRAF